MHHALLLTRRITWLCMITVILNREDKISIETRSGHPCKPGHFLPGSSGSHLVYKSSPDWIT